MGMRLALLPGPVVMSGLLAVSLCAHLAIGAYIVDMLFLVVSRSTEAAGTELGAGVKLGEASVATSDPDPVDLDTHPWSCLSARESLCSEVTFQTW